MYATGETWTPAALGGGVPGPSTGKGNIMKIARASVVSLLQLALFSTAHAVSQTDRVAAANDTANSITHPTNFCSGLRGPGFYWEIGTSGGPLSDPNLGTVGGDLNGEPRQDTLMKIASASKWIYAAYVVERFGASVLTPRDYEFLTLTSGYHSRRPVAPCRTSRPSTIALRSVREAAAAWSATAISRMTPGSSSTTVVTSRRMRAR